MALLDPLTCFRLHASPKAQFMHFSVQHSWMKLKYVEVRAPECVILHRSLPCDYSLKHFSTNPSIYHSQQRKKMEMSKTPQLVCRILPSGSGGGRTQGCMEGQKKNGRESDGVSAHM